MSSESEPRAFPWRLFLASLAALLSLAALGTSIAWRVNTTNTFREQTVSNCQQIEVLKVAITGVLIDERARVLNNNPDPALRKAVEKALSLDPENRRARELRQVLRILG